MGRVDRIRLWTSICGIIGGLILCHTGCRGSGSSDTPSPPARSVGIIPPERRTTWNPGIPGGIPAVTTIHTTIEAATYGNGTTDATAAINNAIQAAGNTAASTGVRQVVYLPAGTYRTSGPIELSRSNVVLRGAGASRTRIRLSGTEQIPAARIGIFWPDYHGTGVVNLVGSVEKGATSITVSDASGIQVGDIIQIDQLDDTSYVVRGDCTYFKRGPGSEPPSPEGWRSVGEQAEVASKNGNVLGLSGPVHIAFNSAFSPRVFKTATARSGEWGTRYAGLEDLYVTGGNNDNITLYGAAYCWVKNVESDGDPNGIGGVGMVGDSISMDRAYRCEIRGCYAHHARDINPGGGAYGIAIRQQSSNNLIEDNIMYMLNKPLAMSSTGGGNVVAYNYADQAIISYQTDFMETGLDANHCSFSHFELFEGNWSPNLGGDTTHGNSGWITFFRNYGRGRNSDDVAYQNVQGANATGYSRYFNYAGNVLLHPNPPTLQGAPPIYESSQHVGNLAAAAAFRIGNSADPNQGYPSWDDGSALAQVYRHGNYDYVTNSVTWDPANADHSLPNSLYLTDKPAFFGSLPWPWVDPTGATKVASLPAKARFDSGTPIAAQPGP